MNTASPLAAPTKVLCIQGATRDEIWNQLQLMPSPNVLVVAGGSGSGKTTLTRLLLHKYPEIFCRLSRCSTRPRREKDAQEADDHRFLTESEFAAARHRVFGLTHPYGYSYGFLDEDLLAASRTGKIWVTNCMIQFGELRDIWPGMNVRTVAVTPIAGSEDAAGARALDYTLRNRICRRDPTISTQELDDRVSKAVNDLSFILKHADSTVVNMDGQSLEATFAQFERACLRSHENSELLRAVPPRGS